jgi:hypothetical protein
MPTRFHMTSRFALLAATIAFATACGPDAPTSPMPSNDLLSTTTTTLTTTTTSLIPVTGLLRDVPLAQTVTVSQTIDNATGGTIRLPEAGLTVAVPAGFTTGNRSLTFTVTAYAGRMVAYEFGPAGAKFRQPLQVVQALQGTNWFNLPAGATPLVGYFADPAQLDLATGRAKVNELLPLNVDLGTSKLRFDISHFSGYMVSSGRMDEQ